MVNGKFAVALIYHILLPLVDGAFFVWFFCFDERTCEAASTVSWPQPNLSFEVLAEYVWLDADGVTRSKTMTMTARWGAVGVRSGIQNPEQDSHHVREHRVVMTQRSILC